MHLELHERRFLTADDLAYLESVEVALVRTHGIPVERASAAVRQVARVLQRTRVGGEGLPAAALFGQHDARGHAEAIAAMLLAPRARSPWSLALLALLAAIAGLLGMRVVLALIFRRFEPVRIGWVDVTLAAAVVAVILGAERSRRLPGALGRGNWMAASLVLGVAIGLGVTVLLRRLDAHRTLATLPLWAAALLAIVAAALTWLFTWPDDGLAIRATE